jgi:hypothetical protein
VGLFEEFCKSEYCSSELETVERALNKEQYSEQLLFEMHESQTVSIE